MVEAPAETVLFAGDSLRAVQVGRLGRRVIFTFDNYSKDRSGWDAPVGGTSFTDMAMTRVHITTRRNDWYLSDGWDALCEALNTALAESTDRTAIGFSMGGYGVVRLAQQVPLTKALLFSPHTTFEPLSAVPNDRRFPSDVADMDHARAAYLTTRSSHPATCECVIVYDPLTPHDSEQAREAGRLFAATRYLELEGGGHPANLYLAKGKRWGKVMLALAGDRIREGLIENAYSDVRRKMAARETDLLAAKS